MANNLKILLILLGLGVFSGYITGKTCFKSMENVRNLAPFLDTNSVQSSATQEAPAADTVTVINMVMTHAPVTGGNLTRPMDMAIELAAKAKRDGRRVQINIIHPDDPDALHSSALEEQARSLDNIAIYYVHLTAVPKELTHPDQVIIRGMDLDNREVLHLRECYASAKNIYYLPRFMSDRQEDQNMVRNLSRMTKIPEDRIQYVSSGFEDDSWGVAPSPKEECGVPVADVAQAKTELLTRILKKKRINPQNLAELSGRRWGATYGRGDEVYMDEEEKVLYEAFTHQDGIHAPFRTYFSSLIKILQARPDLPAPAIFWPRGLFFNGEFKENFDAFSQWIDAQFRYLDPFRKGRLLYFLDLKKGLYTTILFNHDVQTMPRDFVPRPTDLVIMAGEGIDHGSMLKMWDIIGHKNAQGAYSQILPLYTGEGSAAEVWGRGLFGIHDGVLSRINDSDFSFFFNFLRKRIAAGDIHTGYAPQEAAKIVDVMEAVHYVQQRIRKPREMQIELDFKSTHARVLQAAVQHLNLQKPEDLIHFAAEFVFDLDQSPRIAEWRAMVGAVMEGLNNFLDNDFDLTDRIYNDIFPASADDQLLKAA